MKNPMISALVAVSFCYLMTSCAGLRNEQLKIQLEKSNCNQLSIYSYTAQDIPTPIEHLKIDSDLKKNFGRKSLNIANAIGALHLLKKYADLKKDYAEHPSTEKRLELLECTQKINQRINIASLEISAVASEMDCEEERADQIASYLKDKEDNIETKLTVGGLVIGASGALASGFLVNKGNANDYLGIGTGIAGAVAGVLILTNKTKVEFYHKRNPLGDIWHAGETSTIFPPAVWYYLNYEDSSDCLRGSLRNQIKQKWMDLGEISGIKAERKRKSLDLYFGAGGKYTAEQLSKRADMLDQIESIVNLMKQDLKEFALAFETIDTPVR
ncbi:MULTISPECIES: hypothetical protein [Chryseobacterium]|nr:MULTISPECIES: hypothetical protein [Chryseobacterium]EFK36135.1 hypothetical protein HMPREF0204_15204 [Chryseobacterium gleum ATCC 35910]QQY31833.1 hypothetical protein I6I60_23805 [Chryseobacterium gleum]VFA43939.1 Uncharacterised protein [Chryseobacterium indologenes]HAF35313.1 hypothetical protein [Sphingobacterium sp.]